MKENSIIIGRKVYISGEIGEVIFINGDICIVWIKGDGANWFGIKHVSMDELKDAGYIFL